MADYTQQLKKYLHKAGCRFERQGRGDHEICTQKPKADLTPSHLAFSREETTRLLLKGKNVP